jgi:hypothetical protein
MSAQVILHGSLKEVLGQARFEVASLQLVGQVIKQLNIPEGFPYLLVVDGQLVDHNYLLLDGNQLEFVPPIDGG